MNKTTLPAGTYWLGDPCYVVGEPHESWLKLVDAFYGEDKDIPHTEIRVVELNGQKMVWSNTNYGDGVYWGTNGFNYGVDAGLLGIVPVDLIHPDSSENGSDRELGAIVEFTEDVVIERLENSIKFGDVEILVGDEYDEDDDNSYYGDEEDYCDTCSVYYWVDGWTSHDSCEDEDGSI